MKLTDKGVIVKDFLKDLTWKCAVCGKTRPDKFISVHTKDRSEEFNLPPGSFTQNIKYCNDNFGCKNMASTIKL